MNGFYGSCIDFPPRADARGTFVTTADPQTIVDQGIMDIIETRRGERDMVPDYGIRDFVFSVVDATFSTRVADELEQQVKRYMPLVRDVAVKPGADEEGRVTLNLTYTMVGEFNAPKNMVYPIWRLRGQ